MKARCYAPDGIGGEIAPPPDKSITHRLLMLAAAADGTSRIINPLDTGDCLSTRRCLAGLGVEIRPGREGENQSLQVRGVGLRGFREPGEVLDAGNSGTSLRLLAGLLAGLPVFIVLSGDDSLRSRPMLRVVEPLRRMGARIEGREGGRFAPLALIPGDGSLNGVAQELKVASAQVKSALLLAALRGREATRITGRMDSRDHTERLFKHLGLPLTVAEKAIECGPVERIPPLDLEVPGDPSSAAFFISAALISGRKLIVRGCCLNPTRLGFVEVVRRMGARIQTVSEDERGGEPVGRIVVEPAGLRGVEVGPEQVPFLIDEIPLVAALGAFAQGVTTVRGAGELRHKESDRIAAIAGLIQGAGGCLETREDGFSLEGPQKLEGGVVDSRGDHRIAMSAAVLSAGVRGSIEVLGFEAASVSYPGFQKDFQMLGGRVE